MQKIQYPVYRSNISKKLSKYYNKNHASVFWFDGGNLLKRKDVVKNDEIIKSLETIYSHLAKLNKSKNKKKFRCFRWCIHYTIPEIKKSMANKFGKKYQSVSDKNSHTLEPICTDWDKDTKLNVSSDLFQSKNEDVKNPYGPLIEVLILIANLQKDLKEINFINGVLYHGWLSRVANQGLYLREKLKHWGWVGSFPLDIKKPINFSPTKMISGVIQKIPKSWLKEATFIAKKRISFLKSKIYGEDLEALIYLRNEIDPKIKFTFTKLDKTEKKILKKFSII